MNYERTFDVVDEVGFDEEEAVVSQSINQDPKGSEKSKNESSREVSSSSSSRRDRDRSKPIDRDKENGRSKSPFRRRTFRRSPPRRRFSPSVRRNSPPGRNNFSNKNTSGGVARSSFFEEMVSQFPELNPNNQMPQYNMQNVYAQPMIHPYMGPHPGYMQQQMMDPYSQQYPNINPMMMGIPGTMPMQGPVPVPAPAIASIKPILNNSERPTKSTEFETRKSTPKGINLQQAKLKVSLKVVW